MKAFLNVTCAAVALAVGGHAGASENGATQTADASSTSLQIQPLQLSSNHNVAAAIEALLAGRSPAPEQEQITFEMRGHWLADGSLRIECDQLHEHGTESDLHPHEAEK
jgi:Flp pilus assembly protein TadD